MKIRELVTGEVVLISRDATLKAAAETMRDNDIGALPVEEEGVLEGMLTDRDIVVRAVAKGLDPAHTLVGEIMTPGLVTCFEDQSVEDAAALLRAKKVRRAVVLDREERPVGVVSLGDIAGHGKTVIAAETLKRISEPIHSKRS